MITICVDFDGTIADHRYPDIGDLIPGAKEWLSLFKELGCTLILHTMRSDHGRDGPMLTQAKEFCEKHVLCIDHYNVNPTQKRWSSSPKTYAHLYIDDAAVGCPLRPNPRVGGRPFVDWDAVGPIVMERIQHEENKRRLRKAHDDETLRQLGKSP